MQYNTQDKLKDMLFKGTKSASTEVREFFDKITQSFNNLHEPSPAGEPICQDDVFEYLTSINEAINKLDKMTIEQMLDTINIIFSLNNEHKNENLYLLNKYKEGKVGAISSYQTWIKDTLTEHLVGNDQKINQEIELSKNLSSIDILKLKNGLKDLIKKEPNNTNYSNMLSALDSLKLYGTSYTSSAQLFFNKLTDYLQTKNPEEREAIYTTLTVPTTEINLSKSCSSKKDLSSAESFNKIRNTLMFINESLVNIAQDNYNKNQNTQEANKRDSSKIINTVINTDKGKSVIVY